MGSGGDGGGFNLNDQMPLKNMKNESCRPLTEQKMCKIMLSSNL